MTTDPFGVVQVQKVDNINAYLVPGQNVAVVPVDNAPSDRAQMRFGNHPYYANELMLTPYDARQLVQTEPLAASFIRPLYGSQETIDGVPRYCIWVTSETLGKAMSIPGVWSRVEAVRTARLAKLKDVQAVKLADMPYRFRDQHVGKRSILVVPIVSSENRDFLPLDLISPTAIVHNRAFAAYDVPLWTASLLLSRIHLVWIGAVCGRLEMRFVYSNTLGWNTFPVPKLTEQDKADLTACAENILLAREAHFPATIADLYDPQAMPANLRAAHDANDETLERIYIGRRFRNDTERLEKLFEMYSAMTAAGGGTKGGRPRRSKAVAP